MLLKPLIITYNKVLLNFPIMTGKFAYKILLYFQDLIIIAIPNKIFGLMINITYIWRYGIKAINGLARR
jgi:hypothetical protein